MTDLWLAMFAVVAGFTASGITATIYKIAGVDTKTSQGKYVRAAVMVFAGPAMLFDAAMRGFIDRRWPAMFFWLATAGVAYWSLALGLLVIQVAQSLSA